MASRNPYPTAAPFLPEHRTMMALRDAVQRCEGCPLYADATQAVFGDGLVSSTVVVVGEQPGDQEDLAGAPFVGPAGQVLDRALAELVTATIHPSAVLRGDDREALFAGLVADLRLVSETLAQ